MVDVFISYSRTDLAAVTQLARMVEAEGYQVWWDADLPPHLSYGDVITAKIGMAKAAIVVWSKAAAASEWVRAEADMARNQKKLVQTALDKVMPPLPFNQIQFAEIGDWHGEAEHPGWRKVKASLAELCGPGADSGSRPVLTGTVHAPPPAAATPSRWPLYAGIGIGAAALAVAGWTVLRDDSQAEQVVTQPQAVQPVPAPLPAEPAPAEQAAPAVISAPTEPSSFTNEVVAGSTEGMVIPDSGQRLLSAAEIAQFGPATLELARNEIYARKGRRFARPHLRAHFSQFAWYRPSADNVTLSAIERQNVALLREAEARYGR